MARGFDAVSDNSSRDNLRESDLWEIYPLAKKAAGQWTTLRILSLDFLPIKKHWVRIMAGKEKSKLVKIPVMCVNFDPDNKEPLRGMKCPWCALEHGDDKSGAPAQYDFKWYVQAISRDEQESKPRKLPKHTSQEKKTGKKDKDSDSWTPVVVVPITNSLANKIKQLGERNFHKVKDKKTGKKVEKAFPINDKKYGCDVEIKYDAKAAAANKYTVERGKHRPITEEEEEYLTWNFDDWEGIYNALGRLDEKAALTEFKRMDIIGGSEVVDDDDDDDDDDDSMSLGKKKKGKKSNDKKRRKLNDDEDDDDDDDDDDEDDRKSKKSKKSKSRKLLDDDDDEDDRKSKKKKKSSDDKKKSSKKKKKSSDDDDEDEDSGKSKKKKKKSSDDKKSKKKKK
ncbi:single strand DNA binding protein [Dickeya phage vB_DsoM_JA29]|uniref:Putative ssDNA binding protein n=1 Tax=Dickeya phage vB_DsoM_JA29 TaxID=2283031 RepID=A0A384ZXJ9_9CAUD|nr:single strand DNA binding protein [Dickeya phage vB_DsoM_JA29]AXG66949.1 putative ssDNA binding protein [Dickeya phage vB_DsoM_JA29]